MARIPEQEQPWTVLRILRWTAGYFQEKGMASPRLDAELLLADLLQTNRVGLYIDYERPLDTAELKAYRERVRRRAAHEPVAYILGRCEFWSLPLRVTPDVLIPRPDTEVLVEETIARAAGCKRMLDVGTGSGAIAAAVASECHDLQITALDLSGNACELARENIHSLDLDNQVRVQVADLYRLPGEGWDLIVSNPPYIPQGDAATLSADVRDYEPQLALFVEGDGLACYRALADQAVVRLAPGGWLLVEVGFGQAEVVAALFRAADLNQVFVRNDYADIPRVVGGRRSPAL